MPFRNVKDYIDAMRDGRMVQGHFYKSMMPLGASNLSWVDTGMTTGHPIANYYASEPLKAATLYNPNKFLGIYHGDVKSPKELYLADIFIQTLSAGLTGLFRLMDYVLYYPFIDLSNGATQIMINYEDDPTADILPRYTTGVGLQAYMFAQGSTGGNGQFQFTYINQDGVEKTSPINYCTTAVPMAFSVAGGASGYNSNGGPELRLAGGDTGIRKLLTFTNTTPSSGLGVIVLAANIAQVTISEQGVPVEQSLVMMRPGPPRIYDNAFLAFMSSTISGNMTGASIAGRLNFVWTA
jgi:hypothetical protein